MRTFSSLLLGSMPRHLSQMNRKAVVVKKSYRQYYSLNRHFLCSSQHSCRFYSLRNGSGNLDQLKVEIMSKGFIKPSTPTPKQLRTYEVSLLDQLFPNVYMPFVYFYPNINHPDVNDSVLKQRQVLKQSLSQTLTKFYPLAGRIKDSRHIDCNDNGVYYVEAKVDHRLSDFLKHPDNKSIHRLLPLDPNSKELLSKNDLAMVQLTVFSCGGISICLYTSHKIIDGYSRATFLKSWAATANKSNLEQINPRFISASVLPSNPALPQNATSVFFPLYAGSKTATRRFLFRTSSLVILKQKTDSSRVLAVTGLIWKCALSASRAQSTTTNYCSPKSSTLTLVVNLRDKTSPPSPPHSIGNFFVVTTPIQCGGSNDLGLDFIVQSLKNATSKFSSEFIERMKGYWLSNRGAFLYEMKTWYSDKNAKHMVVTSICKSGTYDADFGWGKPIWACVGNGDSDFPLTENFVMLMDTRCGRGIEAWVTLSEEDMAILEHDPELLAFASLNTSPLEPIE